ncbi:hypothetical protein Syun_020860 [Stephania yunnanensis]|uniref:Pentatricopeptide repeat-containing protein n=1 Tax=Stephania yunnanensis TaxID=152371 RepID=A0AAP0IFF3_9MAGN
MSLIHHCTNMRHLKLTHAIYITHGLHANTYAVSKLISFTALSPSGDLTYASLLFTHAQSLNSFIYNTLIRAYSRSPTPHLALHFFHLMLRDPFPAPDHLTFPFALIACANASRVEQGEQIHSWVVKVGLAHCDRHVQTALLRFYVQCGGLGDARKVFDEIPQRDAVHWNVLVSGYLRCGLAGEALVLFRMMLGCSGVVVDEFCVATGLAACAQSGALKQGMWIHQYVRERDGFGEDEFVGTALVDMYGKCGCIDDAAKVFEEMPKRNVFSWSAMIGAFALHGFAREAFLCLDRMVKEDGIRPDSVVLLGTLTACTHAGLVVEGWFLLENMEALYGVVPKHEHYSCMVDLLCRAGRLDEAFGLIKRMPMRPLASVWGALLSTCRTRSNVELAEIAVEELLLLEHDNGCEEDGAYVQLSNIYVGANRGDDARRIRKLMGERGIKKTPGCSAVEVDGEVSEFVSGDVVHRRQIEIIAMLELLSFQMNDLHFREDRKIAIL